MHDFQYSLGFYVTAQASSPKDTIRQYNLDKSQLAFTIGQKENPNEAFPSKIYTATTVYSDIMVKNTHKDVDEQTTNSASAVENQSSTPQSTVYKYAPKSGSMNGNDEILIFFRKKLRIQKYGGKNNMDLAFRAVQLS